MVETARPVTGVSHSEETVFLNCRPEIEAERVATPALRLFVPASARKFRYQHADPRDTSRAGSPQTPNIRFVHDAAQGVRRQAKMPCTSRQMSETDDAKRLSFGMALRRKHRGNQHGIDACRRRRQNSLLRVTRRGNGVVRVAAAGAAYIAILITTMERTLRKMQAVDADMRAGLWTACYQKNAALRADQSSESSHA